MCVGCFTLFRCSFFLDPPRPQPLLSDDLRKSRGLHLVSAYRSMPAGVAQSRHAFVGGGGGGVQRARGQDDGYP